MSYRASIFLMTFLQRMESYEEWCCLEIPDGSVCKDPELSLLWLCHSWVQFPPLAWELPYAAGGAKNGAVIIKCLVVVKKKVPTILKVRFPPSNLLILSFCHLLSVASIDLMDLCNTFGKSLMLFQEMVEIL